MLDLTFPRRGLVRYRTPLTSVHTKFNPDQWVRNSINLLVLAARAAYEDDDALTAYKKVLRSIRRNTPAA
jgi:hypothetical protein